MGFFIFFLFSSSFFSLRHYYFRLYNMYARARTSVVRIFGPPRTVRPACPPPTPQFSSGKKIVKKKKNPRLRRREGERKNVRVRPWYNRFLFFFFFPVAFYGSVYFHIHIDNRAFFIIIFFFHTYNFIPEPFRSARNSYCNIRDGFRAAGLPTRAISSRPL